MYDAHAIESINFEQLATVTDRLLLGGRPSKRPLGHTTRAPIAPARIAAGTQRLPVLARSARRAASDPGSEHTMIVRRAPGSPRLFALAVSVVIPALLGIAAGFLARL